MDRDAIGVPITPAAAPSPPTGGEIHVWRIRLCGEDRRGPARHALGAILAAYLGGPAEAELSIAEGGKPRLANAPGRLSFNLSHSGELALVAVAPGEIEVGVDIERLRPRRDLLRLADRRLPAADAAAVAGSPEDEREAAFYAAWTRHEARVKCTGAGLDGGTSVGDDIVAHQLEIDSGYAAAFALSGQGEGGAPISVRRFDFPA